VIKAPGVSLSSDRDWLDIGDRVVARSKFPLTAATAPAEALGFPGCMAFMSRRDVKRIKV